MDATTTELVITPPGGGAPVRARITRALTTIGADPDADVRVPGLPARWAVVQRKGDALWVRALVPVDGAAPEGVALVAGARVSLGGVGLALRARVVDENTPGLPVDALAEALCGVDTADQALRQMLRGVVAATGADTGAIIVQDGERYTVAVAEDARGQPLPDAAELLSDTIVRDVLQSRERVRLGDAAGSTRYARVASVVSLRLRSVLCVPLALSGRVLGAVFLGKQGVPDAFTERHAADLGVLVQMAVPLLVQLRRATVGRGLADDLLVGDSPEMRDVRALIARLAGSDLAVLVLGETGTGKEVAARAIHAASPRAGRPMVALNCSAVPEALLGAELFGSRRGAFTGAVADRKGLIEEADGATLFLDEVGDMPPAMQAALLRVLETREVTRVGENAPRPVDFRLVAATHKDLAAEVAAGRFREDLLYRLQEFTLTLPPLAERDGDAVLLAQLFLRQAEAQLGLPVRRLGADARALIERHPWPGNVRELRAAMRRAALLCDGPEVGAAHLHLVPASPTRRPSTRPPAPAPAPPGVLGTPDLGDLGRTLGDARDDFAARYAAAVLQQHDGNRERTATALGISIRSLYRIV